MENVIIIVMLLAIAGGIIRFLWKARKQGQTCIGCSCSKQCGGNCGCARQDQA